MDNVINCDDCDYQGIEERWVKDNYYSVSYCNLCEQRELDLDEGEQYPEWCPLVSKDK
jgi:hypothetical protein